MTIERLDPTGAEATVHALYPNEALRSRCLAFFAEALTQAHALGEAKWSVTLRKRQVSLNVGKLLAVGLSKGRVYLGLPPTRLSEDLATLLEAHGVWDKEFSTFPSTRLIELSAESFIEFLDQLRAPFADFLRIAAETARQPPVYRSHSPGVLAYLQKALGRELPAPVYIARGGEEEPEQDTPRPRAVAIKTPPVLFERVEYHLDNLLSYVEMGDIGLPDIQRPFVWKWSKVRDLLDSMYRGYPVGYLLFWTNEDVQGTRQIGTGAKQHKVPQLLVVDGQQRLTSLFAVFKGHAVLDEEFGQVRVEIAFRPRDGKFEVTDAAIRKDPEFIPNISELWSSGKPTSKLIKEFLKKLDEKKGLDEEEEDAISHNIERLVALNKYPFTALKILPSVEEEAVSNIFVRINSEGVKLNQADFILTLLSVFSEQSRAELESFCRQARTPVAAGGPPSPFNHYIEPSPDQLLRVSVALAFDRARLKAVYQILRGKNPESGQVSAERRQRQFEKLRDVPAITRDNQRISLNINAGLLVDMPHLAESGADGVGLFRTELHFMLSHTFPRLERQIAAYSAVLKEAAGKPVVFRALDIGGDKVLPYLRQLKEENPAIGWRAIRMSLDRPALFRSQVRAFMRAAAGQELHLMVPMVSAASEMDQIRVLIQKERARLRKQGHQGPKKLRLGAMLEVPSVLFELDQLLAKVDFISVGSNDLLQFLFAADRTNAHVANRYDSLSIAPLRALKMLLKACKKHSVPVTVCGEMAGRPIEAMVLIGLGFRSISMAPASIGPVKSMILGLDTRRISALLNELMRDGTGSIRSKVERFARSEGIDILT